MCKNCKASPLGIQRQAELDAAIEACKALNIDHRTNGFIARYAWQGYTPQYSDEQRQALDRYNNAMQAMKDLHQDFVFDGMRRAQEEALKKRGRTGDN
jgi:hypothetical protein